jgi:DNA-binding SARP family transcriptional activator
MTTKSNCTVSAMAISLICDRASLARARQGGVKGGVNAASKSVRIGRMTNLVVHLLGRFAVTGPSGPIGLSGGLPKALLAVLAMSAGTQVSRDRVIGLFWPDRPESQARHSLRQSLSVLRATLGTPLSATATDIALAAVVDAVEFQRLAAAEGREGWEQAIESYCGPLLDGFAVRAPAFEAWLAAERRRLHEIAVEVLHRMAREAAAAGNADRAVALARRLVRLEPAHEQGHMLLIRTLAALGERGAAMQQYRTLSEHLRREYDARPSAGTEAAYRAVLAAPQPFPGDAPARPAVAVLPFLPGGGERDALIASGCAEELVTMLGRLGDLLVIDRHATEGYEPAPGDLHRIGLELDARFLLRGTVRTARDRLRVTAQLVELPRQAVRWSGTYERPLDDIFAVQAAIADEVATALQVKLTEGEQVRLWRRATSDAEAWLLFVEGLGLVRGITRERNFQGRERLQQAIARDPSFAPAWVYLGWSHILDLRSNWTPDPQRTLAEAERCAERALALDPELPDALNLSGGIDLTLGRHEATVAVRRRAVALSPNHSESHAWLAAGLYYAGNAAAAEKHIALAMRLSPFYPGWYPIVLGWVRLAAGRLAEAERAFAESCERLPDNLVGYIYLIVAQVIAGKHADARRTAADVTRRSPDCTIEQARRWLLYRDPKLVQHRLECLRHAGLPE